MNRFLLFLGVLLVGVLAALFAVPAAIDWNAYRGSIERQTSAILGREVRIGGDVALSLLPSPFLHVENVRIADASGRFDRPLLRLGGFTMWLSVAPLLRGDLEVRDLRLEQPELRLAVDESGRGNWQGLGSGEAGLPITPGAVTLGSISIDKGLLVLSAAGDRELGRISGLTGDLSATALNGPFRFKGVALLAGETRELRVASGLIDDPAGIRLKAVVSGAGGAGAVYTLDGVLSGVDGVPTFTGTGEAALALSPRRTDGKAAAVVEVKSSLAATLDGATLTDIVASFDSEGRPQQISGSADVRWDGATRLTADLQAGWLDLDRILAGSGQSDILASLRGLAAGIAAAVPNEASATIQGRLAQAQFGSATISDIAVGMEVTPDGFRLSRLTARLPGQSEVELMGELSRAGAASFTGPVRVRGTSLPRLAGWILPGLQLAAGAGERPFVIEGDARLSVDGLLVENLHAEIAGTSLTSRIHYNTAEPRTLEVGLDSDRLDLRDVLELPATLTALRDWLAPPAQDGTAGGPLGVLAGTETRIEAHIGRLLLNGGEMQDVAVDLHSQGGRLDVTRLELATASGLAVDVSGQLVELSASPAGQLRFTIEAASVPAVGEVGRFLELGELPTSAAASGGMAPLRLAGNLALGQRGRDTLDFAVDGMAASSRMIVAARADGPVLERARVDFSATLENADETILLGQLFAGLGDISAMPTSAGPGRLSLSASGSLARGLTAAAILEATALRGRYDGSLTYADGMLGADGRLSFGAPQAELVSRLAGLHRLLPGAAAAVVGEARIAKDGARWRVDEARIDIGGLEGRGHGSMLRDGDLTRVDIDVSLPEASLPQLAGALAGTAAGDAVASEGNLWGDRAIDFSPLAGIEGKVRLTARNLEALFGLNLANARLEAELSGSGVRVTNLTGEALGGRVTATGELAKAPAGAIAAAHLKLAGGQLSALGGAGQSKGSFDGQIELKGRGLSPRGILALLEGSGSITTSDGMLAALPPQAVDAAARVVLSEPTELDENRLAELLARDPLSGTYPFKSFTTALSIADGVVKAEPVALDAEQARLTITTALDLQSLQLDSEWVLKPKPTAPDKQPLPPVTFVYTGPVHDVGHMTPRIEAEALARELTARKYIGGAEQLDGLWPSPPSQTLQEGKAGPSEPAANDTATLVKGAADWDAVIQSQPAQ